MLDSPAYAQDSYLGGLSNGIKHPRTFEALVQTILILHVLFYLWHF